MGQKPQFTMNITEILARIGALAPSLSRVQAGSIAVEMIELALPGGVASIEEISHSEAGNACRFTTRTWHAIDPRGSDRHVANSIHEESRSVTVRP